MPDSQKYIHTAAGATVDVYGYQVSADTPAPWVLLSMASGGVRSGLVLSPDNARELAALLLSAVNAAMQAADPVGVDHDHA